MMIDADGHVMEDATDIVRFLPKPFNQQSLLAFPLWPTMDGWQRSASRIYDNKNRIIVQPNASEWIALMDATGIEKVVLYPTAGLAHGLIVDPVWSQILAQGYNRWLVEHYLHRPDRITGVALLPQDIRSACQELSVAVTSFGMVGGFLPAVSSQTLPLLGDKYYFPLYERACELDCMLGIHGAPTLGLGLEGFHDFAAVRALSHSLAQMRQCTSMIFGGVFEHFPGLRVAFLEGGVGWIPFLLERLDAEYAKRKTRISTSPSEQIHNSSAFFHCEFDEQSIPKVSELIGMKRLISASDFPHEPADEYRSRLWDFVVKRTDLSSEVKQGILRENARRLYNLRKIN